MEIKQHLIKSISVKSEKFPKDRKIVEPSELY